MPAKGGGSSRNYDIIVWGATGFTGKLVAEYMAKYYSGSGLTWALAGRSRGKLEAVAADVSGPSGAPPPLVLADSADPAALEAMAAQATVVITTVGPYQQHGAPLVAACLAAGTHYVDLTGEAPFVRSSIDAHHEAAAAKGVKIVHCCGFDSVPSDLGTLLVVSACKDRGLEATRVDGYFGKSKGGASGGTLASVLGLFELPLSTLARLGNPYFLNPTTGGDGRPQGPCPPGCGDRAGLAWRPAVLPGGGAAWTMPFVMAAVNTRVVRRSAALAAAAAAPPAAASAAPAAPGYHGSFAYHESMACPPGLGGLLVGLAVSLGTPLFALLAFCAPTRALLRRLIHAAGLAPGQGPSREMQRTGFFEARFVGSAVPAGQPATTTPKRVVVEVKGIQDPGYAETAKMLSECALCLLPRPPPAAAPAAARAGAGVGYYPPCQAGGVLTPATAAGLGLVDRLVARGMTFRVVDDEPGATAAAAAPAATGTKAD